MAKGDNILQTLIILALIVTFGIYASNMLKGSQATTVDYDFSNQVSFLINESTIPTTGGIQFNSLTNDFILTNLTFADNVQNKVIDFNNLSNVEIKFKATLDQPINSTNVTTLQFSLDPNTNSSSFATDQFLVNFNGLTSGQHSMYYRGVNWIYTAEPVSNNTVEMTVRANLVDDYTFLNLNSINTGFVYEVLSTEFPNKIGLQDFSLAVAGLTNTTNTTLTIDELSLKYN